MDSSEKTTFTGFAPDTFEFLRALAANNRKEWFETHKDEYRKFLQKPLQQLAAALAVFRFSLRSSAIPLVD